ncbi:MAG: phospholipase D-like domain-containing protein [Bacteroidota bacterium]
MAEFYTTRGIAYNLDELLKEANSFVYLITPYLKFSDTLYDRLKSISKKEVDLTIVFGKAELSKEEKQKLEKLECNIYYKDNLHAKCYINEKQALIGSMNLYRFSEVNNIEMGIKIDKMKDRDAYKDCLNEILGLIENSTPKRELNKANIKKHDPNAKTIAWYELLKKTYPNVHFTRHENLIEAEGFPMPNMNFSNDYGFACIETSKNNVIWERLNNKRHQNLLIELKHYRFYLNQLYNGNIRMSLYPSEDAGFNNLEQELDYSLKGTKILLDQLKKLNR